MRQGLPFAVVAAAFGLALAASPVAAKCKRMGFQVNDYGKEGPTKDAKDLLDKHIAQKMAEQGVKKYTVGKKDVKCELFLNLIVVDEHTCTAEANVCWDEPGAAPATTAAPATPAGKQPKAAAKAVTPAATPAAADEAKKSPPKSAGAPSAKAPTGPATPAPLDAVVTPVEEKPAEAAAPRNAPSAAEAAAAAFSGPPEPAATESEPPAVGGEETAGAAPEPKSGETGTIEKFAAPKKIVIPDPIRVKRGQPVPPGRTEPAPAPAPAPETAPPTP